MKHSDLIHSAAIFVAVVQTGSIRRAARELGISKATVSRHVRQLEEELSVRLMDRTTRSMSVTPEGLAFIGQFEKVRSAWQTALDTVAQTKEEPSGLLRLTAPELLVEIFIVPTILRLQERHPKLNFEILAQDSIVDLVTHNMDVALRAGTTLKDSSYFARRFATTREVVVCAPDVRARYGTSAAALQEAPWLTHSVLPVGPERAFQHTETGVGERIHLSSRVQSSSSTALFRLVENGAGLFCVPELFVARQLHEGVLVALPWQGREAELYAIYPSARLATPRLRTFMATLEEVIAELNQQGRAQLADL